VKGDYDDLLDWPFTGKITLTILDQSKDFPFHQHISQTVIAKCNMLAFYKQVVSGYKSIWEGHEAMAPIQQVHDPQYIKNDTMLVLVKIESVLI